MLQKLENLFQLIAVLAISDLYLSIDFLIDALKLFLKVVVKASFSSSSVIGSSLTANLANQLTGNSNLMKTPIISENKPNPTHIRCYSKVRGTHLTGTPPY